MAKSIIPERPTIVQRAVEILTREGCKGWSDALAKAADEAKRATKQ